MYFIALFDKTDYLSIKFLWRDILIAIGGRVEREVVLVEFDHDFGDCAF